MDISETIAPRSDQQNYEDYLSGPKTVTISGVSKGNTEQPVNIELAEYPGRPFKPSKTARRVLVAAWGPDASQYVGRRMTLFGDPTVKWAGEPVGGIRISHLSHIDKPLNVALTVTRGKRQKHTVKPLTEPAPKADKTTGEVIPENITATLERITTAQEMNDYFAWLTEQGAPAHILNYVSAQIELKENQ